MAKDYDFGIERFPRIDDSEVSCSHIIEIPSCVKARNFSGKVEYSPTTVVFKFFTFEPSIRADKVLVDFI